MRSPFAKLSTSPRTRSICQRSKRHIKLDQAEPLLIILPQHLVANWRYFSRRDVDDDREDFISCTADAVSIFNRRLWDLELPRKGRSTTTDRDRLEKSYHTSTHTQ